MPALRIAGGKLVLITLDGRASFRRENPRSANSGRNYALSLRLAGDRSAVSSASEMMTVIELLITLGDRCVRSKQVSKNS